MNPVARRRSPSGPGRSGSARRAPAAAGRRRAPVRWADADRPLAEAELVELVRGCWGLIVGVDPVTAAVLDAGPLQVVARVGSGTDNVDREAARRRGVQVAATPAPTPGRWPS